MASGGYLFISGISEITIFGFRGTGLLALASMLPGGLLVVGLWTPVAGILAGLLEATLIVAAIDEPKAGILFICISVAIAMLGPGCWSIDSVLFGRRKLDMTSR